MVDPIGAAAIGGAFEAKEIPLEARCGGCVMEAVVGGWRGGNPMPELD